MTEAPWQRILTTEKAQKLVRVRGWELRSSEWTTARVLKQMGNIAVPSHTERTRWHLLPQRLRARDTSVRFLGWILMSSLIPWSLKDLKEKSAVNQSIALLPSAVCWKKNWMGHIIEEWNWKWVSVPYIVLAVNTQCGVYVCRLCCVLIFFLSNLE